MPTPHTDDCKTAQLHDAGYIQPHGAIALLETSTGKLLACSENLGRITGKPASEMLDQPFVALVPAPLLAGLRLAEEQGKRRLWHTQLDGDAWLVSAYFGAERVLLEFEAAAASSDFDINQRFNFLDDVSAFQQAQEVAEYLLDGSPGSSASCCTASCPTGTARWSPNACSPESRAF